MKARAIGTVLVLLFIVLGLLYMLQDRRTAAPSGMPYPQRLAEIGAESFADAEDAVPDAKAVAEKAVSNVLSPYERELFEDIKSNKLNQDDIKKLIIDGKLTDDVINKFLKHLDFPPLAKKKDVETFVDHVEAFACEDMYVGKPLTWTPEARWWDGSPVDSSNASGSAPVTKLRGTC